MEEFYDLPEQLDMRDFEQISELGLGSFGYVVKVLCTKDGKEYAMKKIRLEKKFSEDSKELLRILREA